MKRTSVLIAAVIGVALAFVAMAGPAAAHVTVTAPGATKGGYAVLTFRVPNEEAKASTVELRVSLPTDTPIASVSVQPHPGWSFTTKVSKLATPIKTDDGDVTQAVSEIVWKADSAATAIKPGEFDQFNISAGPLPDTNTLTLPAIQTYSDGTVVRWIETQAPGSTSEPQHPAPVVTLAAANAVANSNSSDAKDDDGDGPATALSIVALALAAAALGFTLISRSKQRGGRSE
ncbi:MAG TPA: YcnI family protein [Jatrophihabitantaceae bacterium]|nr:YcnI family protein [Jatrophihabitantaceae bacterium]